MVKRMAGRSRVLARLVCVVLVAASCSGGDTTAALPEAPDVLEVRSGAPVVPDDGVLRVTVELPAEAADEADEGGIDRDQSSSIFGTIESPDGSGDVTFDEILGLPQDSTLAIRDGEIGYLDANGDFTPLDSADTQEVPIGPGITTVDESAEFLAALPGVVDVRVITETNFAVAATSTESLDALGLTVAPDVPLAFSTDPYEPYQWALENDGASLANVGLPQPPAQTPDADIDGAPAMDAATGAGVVVAVIDSGVDFSHPDLAHARWVNGGEDCAGSPNGIDDDGNGYIDDCAGWDFGDEDATPFGGNNDPHGTHVAGIIAAQTNNNFGVAGVAPGVEVMDLKVNHSSGMISMSSIARAIRYAVDNGAHVVNLSLGTEPGASLASVGVLADAVDYAHDNGVLLVAAAGNSGVSLDNAAVYPASFTSPSLLTVGATTSADRRASFTNTGSAVDLFAPGDLILSTTPGGDVIFMSGTSQAAPIAAATAALMLESGSQSPATLIDAMARSGDRLDALDGAAANPVRLNTARAIGIEADIPEVGDAVTIRGLADDVDGAVSAAITIGELGGQFNQPFHWEASLVTLVDGEPFAVVDHPVTVHDVDGDDLRSEQTDGRGSVLLADKSSQSAEWSTTLPPGSYALLVEAVPRTDSTARLGDGFLARFDVGDVVNSNDDSGGDVSSGPSSPADDSGSIGSPGVDGGPASEQPAPNPSSGGDGGAPGDSSGGTTPPVDTGGADTGGVDTEGSDPGAGSGGSDDNAGQTSGDADSDSGTSSGTNGSDGGGGGEDGASGASDTDGGGDTSAGSSGSDANDGDSAGAGGGSNDDTAVEVGPDAAQDGDWAIDEISPRTGMTGAENLVVIDGSFPETAIVWFGDTPGEVVFGSESSLMVETPVRAEPATVDVVLLARGDEVLRVPQAYSFVDSEDGIVIVETDPGDGSSGPGGDAGSTPDNTAPSNGNGGSTDNDANSGSGDADEPTFDDDPVDEVEVDGPPTAEDESDSSKSRNRQSRANVTGDPRVLPNGLTGAPLSGLDTIGGVPRCDEALCRTRRV